MKVYYKECSCHKLKRISLPSTVKRICSYAFNNCALEEVELCEGLFEIGERAFSRCKSLKRINIPFTVAKIHDYAFQSCDALEEVELCDGLLEIGNRAFMHCNTLTRIKIPSTVTRIFWGYYQCGQLEEVKLCEGMLGVDVRAFSETKIKRIKIPSTVTLINNYAFANCRILDDVELCEDLQRINSSAFEGCTSLKHIAIPTAVTKIGISAFEGCNSLRDIAIPIDAEIGVNYYDNTFSGCKDLYKLFDSEVQIIYALKHRFDNLPIHKMIHYQSYNNVTVDQLYNATNVRISRSRSKLDATGSQQDCLGMTPLHILACSSVQSIDLYKVLVTKYPGTLIMNEDGERYHYFMQYGEVLLMRLYNSWLKVISPSIRIMNSIGLI